MSRKIKNKNMENNQQNSSETSETKANLRDEVKNYYKGDFKEIFVTIFKNPIDGIFSIFEKPSNKSYTQSLILFSSIFILYLVGGYIIVGEARQYLEFSNFIKISLIPVILMGLITVISFGLKSISGKPNFKAELLTGGLCGVPLGILMPLLLMIKLFASVDNIMSLVSNPAKLGIIGGLILFYILLMLINILQQSLKASGTKDALAWYLSPASILLAIYLTSAVAKNLF